MSAIRADWLARTDGAVERLTDDIATIDVRNSLPLLEHFLDVLDTPPDALHAAVLSTMLTDLCGRIVQVLHEQNPPARCRCDTTIWSHVSRDDQWHNGDPRRAFRDWLQLFFERIETDHPADAAVRAAQVIRREPNRRWTIDTLAVAVNTPTRILRRDFQLRFGMNPTAYMHLARVTRAIGRLRSPAKVETVAWEVGYRSKKDLYAALGRWASATPTELRAMSDDESEWLERELRVRCLRPAASHELHLRAFSGARHASDGGRGPAGTRAFRR